MPNKLLTEKQKPTEWKKIGANDMTDKRLTLNI